MVERKEESNRGRVEEKVVAPGDGRCSGRRSTSGGWHRGGEREERRWWRKEGVVLILMEEVVEEREELGGEELTAGVGMQPPGAGTG